MRKIVNWFEGASQHVVEQLIQMMKREVREQTQKENHTRAFIAGNHKVGADSLSTFPYESSEYHLHYCPKITSFLCEEAPGKSEVSFEQLVFEVRSVQGFYLEPVVRDVIIKSLKGNAADLMRYMTPQGKAERNIF